MKNPVDNIKRGVGLARLYIAERVHRHTGQLGQGLLVDVQLFSSMSDEASQLFGLHNIEN
nr:hypothetical protein [Lujinxingia vulgaris]